LNEHSVSDVRQIEIHIAEPLLLLSRTFGVEIPISSLKNYKSLASDQIPAELIQMGGEILRPEIQMFINSIWNKEELPDKCRESIVTCLLVHATKMTGSSSDDWIY
jgi:hypothetical protein